MARGRMSLLFLVMVIVVDGGRLGEKSSGRNFAGKQPAAGHKLVFYPLGPLCNNPASWQHTRHQSCGDFNTNQISGQEISTGGQRLGEIFPGGQKNHFSPANGFAPDATAAIPGTNSRLTNR